MAKSDREIMEISAHLAEFVEFMRAPDMLVTSGMPEWIPAMVETFTIMHVAKLRMDVVMARIQESL